MKKIIFLIFILSYHISAQKVIEIDLTNQILNAKENSTIALISDICSGKAGYATPAGIFKVLGKERMHISNRYPIQDKEAGIRGGAKMPYMLRVTNTGIAIHAGEMVNYPDSHGCIRIPYGKAMQLFKWADVGTKIKIVGITSYDDNINQMRLSLLKQKKNKIRKKKYKIKKTSISSPPVKWVDDYLDYYDAL